MGQRPAGLSLSLSFTRPFGSYLLTTTIYSANRSASTLPDADGGFKQSRQRMDVMPDSTKHAPQHDKFISLEEDYQIDYWTGKFSVTRDHLAMAIGRVGHSAEALEKYLKHG
jgi:Protein of unknown function (DUF3606)